MKKLLLLGLAMNAVAMLIPSLIAPGYALLLACIFLLGVGTTFLQVAGNPIMRNVSPEGAYSRNLSFAQGIKGLGSTASTYLVTAVATIAMFQGMGWRGVFPLFSALKVAALIGVAMVRTEEENPRCRRASAPSLSLLKESGVRSGGAGDLPLRRRGGLHGPVPLPRHEGHRHGRGDRQQVRSRPVLPAADNRPPRRRGRAQRDHPRVCFQLSALWGSSAPGC